MMDEKYENKMLEEKYGIKNSFDQKEFCLCYECGCRYECAESDCKCSCKREGSYDRCNN